MTRHSTSRDITRAAFLPLLALALILVGCGGGRVTKPSDTSTSAGAGAVVDLPPDLATPEGAVQYLVWTVNRRDWRRYAEILTEDFQFAFASVDSAGNAFRDRCLLRADEVQIARNMFETGTPLLPPFSRVVMTLASAPLVPLPDPRPGRDMPSHVLIRSNLLISADNGAQSFRITGAGSFFLVRGDSAQIPPELLARGFVADKTRWWVQRWEDETIENPGAAQSASMPSRIATWGAVKVMYR